MSEHSNPKLPSVDWKKELENLRERLQHCEKTAVKLKSALESISREINIYKTFMKNRAYAEGLGNGVAYNMQALS